MSRFVKSWLAPCDWNFVTEINRGLCRQKNALHKTTSDGHLPAKTLWEKNQIAELALTDALDVCLKRHRLAPFCFYNGNTFAAIARDFIAELSPAPAPDQAHILRSIAGHIVAGTATDIDLFRTGMVVKRFWLAGGASVPASRHRGLAVPKEQTKIARHFNAGTGRENVESRRDGRGLFNHPCGTRSDTARYPPLKRRAIFKIVPPGRGISVVQKIWLVTGDGCMKIPPVS